jgi:hypothetical protein
MAPKNTVGVGGETMTETGGMVMFAVPVMEGVATSVAVVVWLPTVLRVTE